MGSGRTVMGLAMVLVSLIGLIMASQAVDTAIYLSGLALFVFGVLFVYRMSDVSAFGTD
ncbi:MAG: hypothetical protein VW835_18295 [Rickettsiales bacterium]|jgi:hypothetical protein